MTTQHSRDPKVIGGLALAIKLATESTTNEERQSVACDAIAAAFELYRAYVIQDVAAFLCEKFDAHPDLDALDAVAQLGYQNCERIKTHATHLENLVSALGDYAKEESSGKSK